MKRPIYISMTMMALFACKSPVHHAEKSKDSTVSNNTHHPGYNELANPRHEASFPISDYNTDNKAVKNIDRPSKSIIHTTIDTSLLFTIWTSDPNGPHADFVFSNTSFYVVDYDGDGDMPYILQGKQLTIYYNDFIQEGNIVAVSKDTLKIQWKGYDYINSYVKWKG